MTDILHAPNRKRPANLSLSSERLRFGRQYAKANQTSLSQVVEELLAALEAALKSTGRTEPPDPLDGLLVGWPEADKHDLRAAQHSARLSR